MAIVTNWMLALFCFYAYFNLKSSADTANFYWKRFFLIFGISTIFGSVGHAFFYYLGMPGKIPSWTLGCLSNIMAALGMLRFEGYTKLKAIAIPLVWMKSALLLALSLIFMKFVFVAIDAILTYILYTGIYAFVLKKRGVMEMKWMIIGVMVMLPSAFIFLLKLNVHRWLNKDDLSHLFMLTGIIFFYISMKKWGESPQLAVDYV
jgi:hypothetical protein